jgi:hypothetical protein
MNGPAHPDLWKQYPSDPWSNAVERLQGEVESLTRQRDDWKSTAATFGAVNGRLLDRGEVLTSALWALTEHVHGFHDENHHGGHTEPFEDCAWDLCECAAEAAISLPEPSEGEK